MELSDAFLRIAIAFGLGLLVGLEREKARSTLAGIRTFGMIAVFGAIMSFLAASFGGWTVAAGALAIAALLVAGNFAKMGSGHADPGQTTEVAALAMYGVGALAMAGHATAATVIGGAIAVLLHSKAPMHAFVARLGEDDVRAIMRFALISLVILPILPNHAYGPQGTLNPFETWLMVVLIVAIGLAGFIAQRIVGARVGAVLSGVLGGMVSSTATTLAAARMSHKDSRVSRAAAAIVLIASATMMVRIALEIAIAGPALLGSAAIPIAVLFATLALGALLGFFHAERQRAGNPIPPNPAELRAAIAFGALYAVITLAATLAKQSLGDAGLYAVAAVSGLTDLDAITLSTARLVQDARLDASQGWRVIVAAVVSNLAFKSVLAFVAGGRSLARYLALPFAAAALVGVLLVVMMP